MKIKKAFVVLLHLSLLVGAIFFVKNTIEEFLEGNTMYITTQEPLTSNDLPTVTICWQVDKTRPRNPMPCQTSVAPASLTGWGNGIALLLAQDPL